MTARKAHHRLTRVNGQKFTMPTAYTPAGKMVSLLAHSRFHRLRFQQVKDTNSPLDPRLEKYWEDRRTNALFRKAVADARQFRMHLFKRQNYRCAITGLPLDETSDIALHHVVPEEAGGGADWGNLCFVLKWARADLSTRLRKARKLASLKDVPFSGL
jgi:hypothetical protein